MDIGAPELIIILVIVMLIFGVGRISKIGGELGQGLKEFRHGLQGDKDASETNPPQTTDAVNPPTEEHKTTTSS